MDTTTSMEDGQDETTDAPKWTQWDIEQAWLDVVAARLTGDTDAEALAMRRFSEGLRNSAMGAAGSVLSHLDEKIDKIAALLEPVVKNQRFIQNEVESRADYFYTHFEAFLKDADARFTSYDQSMAAAVEAVAVAGKAHALAEQAVAGVEVLAGRVSDIGERQDGMDQRLTMVEANPATAPALLAGMGRLELALEESKKDRAELRIELTQTRYTVYVIVLIFVIAVLVQVWRG